MNIAFYKVLPAYFELDKLYSFNIYFYDPIREQRLVDVYATTKLSEDHFEKWHLYITKGGYLQIDFDDTEIFYEECDKDFSDLRSANPFYFKMLDLQEKRILEYQEQANATFHLREVINNISDSDDFKPLINRVKSEIMCFPLYISNTVSICTELVDKTFHRDIIPVRAACIAYVFAKQNKIEDIEILASLVIASLSQNIGYGLLNHDLLSDYLKLVDDDIFLKHPMLSIYLLSKTGFEFDKLTKRFILEHHEQSDGSGFPRGKKEDHIHFCSFIINLADQVIQYSSGNINGRKTSLVNTIKLFHKSIPTPGININFPQRLTESLRVYILNEIEEELKS